MTWHLMIVYEDGHTAVWRSHGVKELLEILGNEEEYVSVMITVSDE